MASEETADEKLEKIANTSDLGVAIKRLERKVSLQEAELQESFHTMLVSLKPKNLLKTTLHEVQESTELKHNLFKVALGLGAGYFSRKLIVGQSAGFVKKALGTVLQYGVTHFISKKPGQENGNENAYSRPKKKNIFKRLLSI